MRITNRRTVLETDWINVIAKDIEGWDDAYYTLALPDYTSVLALTSDREIITVRQYRVAIEAETLELPSGLVDAGEEPRACALRELREETGYEASELIPLGLPMVPDTGRMDNKMHCFFAPDVVLNPEAEVEQGLRAERYSEAELAELIRNGTFNHALNLSLLTVAMMEGLINLS